MKKGIAIILVLTMITVMSACSTHTHPTSDYESSTHPPCEHPTLDYEKWGANLNKHWKTCRICHETILRDEHRLSSESKCNVCNSLILQREGFISVHTYDEHENIICMCDYDADGNEIGKIAYQYWYDDEGNITRIYEFTNNQLNSITDYHKEFEEYMIHHYEKYSNGYILSRTIYDNYGNVSGVQHFRANGYMDMCEDFQYVLNSNGEWIKTDYTIYYSGGVKIKTKYNELGVATSKVTYDADDNIISTEKLE